jgi:phospholipase/carboxylesterase
MGQKETQKFETMLFVAEWLPASKRVPRSQQKLMIVLHGRGDRLESYRDVDAELGLPNMNYLILNAPQKFEDGFSWGPLKPSQTSLIPIRARLFALIEQLRGQGWKTRDIYLLGHSQGCLIAGDLALQYPQAFGGFIGVSGYLWFFKGWRESLKKSGARRTPWLITHGTRDRVIRPQEIRRDVQELVSGSIPVLYREFSKGHDFDFDHEIPFIREWLRLPAESRLASARLQN